MDRLGGFWLIVIPAWLWALLPLWAASGGVICIVEWLCLFVTCVPVILIWLGFSVVCCEGLKGRAWRQWFSVPAVCAVSLALAVTDVPMIARFCLSERDLRHYAERADDPDPPHYTNAKHIGLFHVHKVWRHGRAVAFSTDSKLFDHAGVIYAPDGLPTEPLPMEVEELLSARYTHMYGPWFRFEIGD